MPAYVSFHTYLVPHNIIQCSFLGWRMCAPKCPSCTRKTGLSFLKANISQKILNWHSLRHSHSAEICIHFYCLSWLKQARQIKMLQNSALWLCLRLCQFKISWDTQALRHSYWEFFMRFIREDFCIAWDIFKLPILWCSPEKKLKIMGYDGTSMLIYGLIYNHLKSINSVLNDLHLTQFIFSTLLNISD